MPAEVHTLGIDVQTNFIAVTRLGGASHASVILKIPKALQKPGAHRLVYWSNLLRGPNAIQGLCSRRKPHAIVVELPIGTFPKPQSLMVCGVVMMELQRRYDCPVLELTSTDWKKKLGLKGNAGKPELLSLAKALGLDLVELVGDRYVQDLADSFLLAHVARGLLG